MNDQPAALCLDSPRDTQLIADVVTREFRELARVDLWLTQSPIAGLLAS